MTIAPARKVNMGLMAKAFKYFQIEVINFALLKAYIKVTTNYQPNNPIIQL
jgi:hypothetical protein